MSELTNSLSAQNDNKFLYRTIWIYKDNMNLQGIFYNIQLDLTPSEIDILRLFLLFKNRAQYRNVHEADASNKLLRVSTPIYIIWSSSESVKYVFVTTGVWTWNFGLRLQPKNSIWATARRCRKPNMVSRGNLEHQLCCCVWVFWEGVLSCQWGKLLLCHSPGHVMVHSSNKCHRGKPVCSCLSF